MALQSTLKDEPGKLVAGFVPESGPWIIRSFRMEGADDSVTYGESVIDGTTWGQCRKIKAGQALTTTNWKGVVVRDRTKSASDDDKFTDGQMVPVLQFGPVAVLAGENIAGLSKKVYVENDDGRDFHDSAAGHIQIYASFRDAFANNAHGVIDVHGIQLPTIP